MPEADALGSAFQRFQEGSRRRVFKESELTLFLSEHRTRRHQSISMSDLLEELKNRGQLRTLRLLSPTYGLVIRYVVDPHSPYEVALSLKPGSYISHGSALFLHGLSKRPSLTIYVNREQSPKPASRTPLSQESIDGAFAKQPRRSNYIFEFDRYRCVLVSGKSSENLGVVTTQGQLGETIPVTNVARTLIDIAVRPEYSGGVAAVLTAYRRARGRFTIEGLADYVRKLGHAYPFHQAIGFYLSHAGAEADRLEPLRALGLGFDFYLAHGMGEAERDADWRVFYPKGLI